MPNRLARLAKTRLAEVHRELEETAQRAAQPAKPEPKKEAK